MIVILLAAGSGTRMGAHAADRPKALVEVGGQPIIEATMRAFATVPSVERIIAVGGYRAEAIFDFAARMAAEGLSVSAVRNPEYASSGPLRSIAVALDAVGTSHDLAIGNGDTIFTEAAVVALAEARGAALLTSDPDEADDDDVQVVVLPDGMIADARKQLTAAGTAPISAGLLRVTGVEAVLALRRSVEELLGEERRGGRMLTWHSVVARLVAAGIPVASVTVPRRWWWEFDTVESIERYGVLSASL